MLPASSHDSAGDPQLPFPPRYWWLKRILTATGLLIVGLIAIRWWWGWDAERKLQARIAQYRALGQPVALEDFQLPPTPDENNAAYYLKQAAAKITMPQNVWMNFQAISRDLDRLREKANDFRDTITANHEVFELMARATACSVTDWRTAFAAPIYNTTLPELAPQRQLTNFLCRVALYEHVTGNDAAAVQRLREMNFHGWAIVGRQGNLTHILTSTAIIALATQTAESIAPDLQIGPPADGSTRATPAQVRAAIASFLDDDALRKNWRRGFYGERPFALDYAGHPGANLGVMTNAPAWVGRVMQALKPLCQHDALFMLDYNSRVAEAGASLEFAAADQDAPVYPSFACGIERTAHFASRYVLPSAERILVLYYRGAAMRRMAALALALRLYEVEHGSRPAALDTLVPDYLTEIPRDPFAPDGAALRYQPDAPHPLLYSVNSNAIDDGGRIVLKSSGEVDRELSDLVFFLDGQRQHPLSSTAPTVPAASNPSVTDNDESDTMSPSSDAQR